MNAFVVFTTSGTTSRPKMVLQRQCSIVDHAIDAAALLGYTSDDTVMAVMPLCGTFGLGSLMAAVAAGSRVIVTDFELGRTAGLIRIRTSYLRERQRRYVPSPPGTWR